MEMFGVDGMGGAAFANLLLNAPTTYGNIPGEIFGEARESAMADAADELMKEALGQGSAPPKRIAPPPAKPPSRLSIAKPL